MSKKLGDKTALTVSGGYSDPYWKNLNWSDPWGVTGLDIYEDVRSKNVWGAVSLDSRLRDNLTLYLSGQHFDNDFTANKCSLGTGSLGIPRGELIDRNFWQDEANSLAGRLNWMRDSLTANLGFETSRSEMRFAYTLGPLWGPFHTEDEPVREERRGVYANATYGAGDFSVTPGLRYDYNSNSDEFISPSLGLTYLLAPDTLLRGVIASGFSAPYLAAISHSPDLEAETTWTYQAGVETSRLPHLRCKATLFYHDIDDAWKVNETPWTNTGTKRINGVELEGQTDAFHGLSFTANFTLANEDSQDVENDESYTANLIFDYHLKDLGLRTQVAGHYHWMNTGGEEPSYDDFLWDLLIGKDFTLSALSGEIYLKAHNIFNGSQYWDLEFPNPERWLEAGIAFTF
ncbi:MAG: TonB-dependent receptor [Deltaproteobacteria bacterium]|nr:TonB-dependent receptor [Deltaproteobacteria bacterium]